MLSFEIAVTEIEPKLRSPLVMRFGAVQCVLPVEGQVLSRSLLLQISSEEMASMMKEYALGLFMPQKRCFALASLANLTPTDRVFCHKLNFLNDHHIVQYSCQLSLRFISCKQPRIAQIKRPLPPPNQSNYPLPLTTYNPKATNQSLNKPLKYNPSKTPFPKRPLNKTQTGGFKRPTSTQSSNQQRGFAQTMQHVPKPPSQSRGLAQTMQQPTIIYQLEDDHPPMMEFTNYQKEDFNAFQSPHPSNDIKESPLQPPVHQQQQFLTEFSIDLPVENPFSKAKVSLSKNKQDKIKIDKTKKTEKINQKLLTREQMQKMAEEYTNTRKEAVKVPMLRNGEFVLVPLYSLSKEEVMEHAEMQKKVEFERKRNAQLQVKIAEQHKINRLPQKSFDPKQNIEIRTSLSKPITVVEEQPMDYSYSGDFDSLSVSRLSVSNARNSKSRLQSSRVRESDRGDNSYEEDFESYSHSIISKSGNTYRHQRSSDVSQS